MVVSRLLVCLQASELLRKLCMQNMVWSYCKKINSEWKHQVSYFVVFFFASQRGAATFLSPPPLSAPSEQMEQKMVASELFKDKKDNYPQSVSKLFVNTRLSKTLLPNAPMLCVSIVSLC